MTPKQKADLRKKAQAAIEVRQTDGDGIVRFKANFLYYEATDDPACVLSLLDEIAAKDAEIERLTKENEALRRDAANARRFIQMTAKQ